MRTWLTSPVVVLIGLVASVVTLLQVAVAAARWALRYTGAERPRVPALVALVVALAAAPVEWQRVMATAARLGNGGVINPVYPVVFAGPGVVAALALLAAVGRGYRPSWLIAVFGVASLYFAACLYAQAPGAAVWGLVVVFAAPAVLALAHVPAMLARRAARAAA